jgi:TRAP-type C4-dicarboxylate transport system substrate-binding protein
MRPFARYTLVAVASSAAISAVQAQAVTLRMSYWIPPATQPGPHLENWAKQITQASGGSLVVQTFPAAQLGKPTDHYDMARDGVVDIAWAVPGFQAGRFPIFSASELPFMGGNNHAGIAAIDQWYRPYSAKEMDNVHYCMAMSAPISYLNFSNKKVETPADMKGVRMRPTNTTTGRFLSSVGASLVQVPASEAGQAFDRGLVDGVVFSFRLLQPFGLDKHVKYMLDMPVSMSMSAMVMNKKRYEALSPAHRKVIDQFCSSEWAQRIGKAWNDWEEEGKAAVTGAAGKTFYKPSKEAEAQWRAAAQPLHQAWIKEATEKGGIDGKKAYDELRSKLSAAGSAL